MSKTSPACTHPDKGEMDRQLQAIVTASFAILKEARRAKNSELALKAAAEIRQQLKLRTQFVLMETSNDRGVGGGDG